MDRTQFAPGSGRTAATVPALFWSSVEARGDAVWLRQKTLGLWRGWTGTEVGEAVREIAGGLLALGTGHGDGISIVSPAAVEWLLADLAILSCGAVSHGAHPDLAGHVLRERCEALRTTILFVADDEQLDKALEMRAGLARLQKIVVFGMNGLRGFDDPGVLSLAALRSLGRQFLVRDPLAVARAAAACRPEDAAVSVGAIAGAVCTHRALMAALGDPAASARDGEGADWVCLDAPRSLQSRVDSLYAALCTGARLHFVESPETLLENLREISPTRLDASAPLWEALRAGLAARMQDAGRWQRSVCAWSMRVGLEAATCREGGRRLGIGLQARLRVAELLALDTLRKAIGIQRARWMRSDGALASPDIARWYLALDRPLQETPTGRDPPTPQNLRIKETRDMRTPS